MPSMLASENRSKLMSLIRGTGNKTTEARLATALRAAGVRGWRRHLALPGRPDFTFRREKVCVFVHGCFWHGCSRCYRMPRTNSTFWALKVEKNRARDHRVARILRLRGYRVLTIWECDLRGRRVALAVRRVARALASTQAPSTNL